ncbi:MAG: nucleotidyltransferase family protein [Deltaproteobacteria bacterium]|nr:MAG: nucleotidyltransferase family protein [Deltaproteobacteria bacterium]
MPTPGAGIVLAAGSSSRMGRPKALLDAGGRTFLEKVCSTVAAAGVQPVLVVVAHDAQEITAALPKDCVPVPNPNPELGQVSSMALGLEAALQLGKRWALVALVDHPEVAVETARLLAKAADAEPGAVHVPTYKGERGHPVVVPTALAPSLFEAQEGEGARDVFSRLGILVREHAVDDPGILLDVDKPGDLRKLRSRDRK